MKMFFAALVLVMSSSAMAADKYVTVQVCNGGESGDLCRMVTYKVRPPNAPVAYKCTVMSGEGGYEVPCPTKHGVPKWLSELLKALSIPGATPRTPNSDFAGG